MMRKNRKNAGVEDIVPLCSNEAIICYLDDGSNYEAGDIYPKESPDGHIWQEWHLRECSEFTLWLPVGTEPGLCSFAGVSLIEFLSPSDDPNDEEIIDEFRSVASFGLLKRISSMYWKSQEPGPVEYLR